jgi:excisionase family DNA binding protein
MAGRSLDQADWVGLGEASALLGIAPGTLRRWADDGRVAVFTTPGGHRRFSRANLRSLLPAERVRRPALARLGASAERFARAYRPRRGRARPVADAWLGALSDADRDEFRARGRALVVLLLEYLDASDPDLRDARLEEASRVGAEYGRAAADRAVSLSEAVEGFLRFRAPFVAELASVSRRRGLDTREATALLADAETAMDRLLVSMMTGHAVAAVAR